MLLGSCYIIAFVLLCMFIYGYRIHIKNDHIHTNKTYVKQIKLTKNKIFGFILAGVVFMITIGGAFILVYVQDNLVLAITIWIFLLIHLSDFGYRHLKSHIDKYQMIVEPTMHRASKEIDENIMRFYICLVKYNKPIVVQKDRYTNQLMAIKVLNDHNLIYIETTGFGNNLVIQVNPSYRNKVKHYYKKHYKAFYRETEQKHINDWLNSNCDDFLLNENIVSTPLLNDNDLFRQTNGSWWPNFAFYNGLAEIIFVVISFFLKQFDKHVLIAVFLFSITMITIGYKETRERNTLVSIAGFILTIVSTCVSVIALLFTIVQFIQSV